MFANLTENIGNVLDRLRGRGALSEKHVDSALAELRRALIDADVALSVAREFIETVRPRAVGAEVLKSVTPAQQVVKIVHDALVEILGKAEPLSLNAAAPVPIMLVGLQGSGKTTTAAKIARYIERKEKRRVLLASLDTQRPAAMEQLQILGAQNDIAVLPIVEGQRAVDIAARAGEAAKLGGHDVVLLDTAGRTNADAALLAEMAEIADVARPHETLLIADSLTGQAAVNVAGQFHAHVPLNGIVLTRADGDGRGGAALSMRHVTGVPIKLLGTGEAVDRLEAFDPERIAGRILGMGDVVGLVEKASETLDAEKADKLAAKMQKGRFDLDDLAEQLLQMRKMGGLGGLLDMLPGNLGGKKMKSQAAAMGMDDRYLVQQAAIVSSMTPAEKTDPRLLNASRKRRIAAGSGTSVQEVNKLLKMHRQMADMMKKMGKGGMKNLAAMGGMPNMAQLPPGFDLPRRK